MNAANQETLTQEFATINALIESGLHAMTLTTELLRQEAAADTVILPCELPTLRAAFPAATCCPRAVWQSVGGRLTLDGSSNECEYVGQVVVVYL